MNGKIITLCYRKIISANNTNAWDKFVFTDTYTEFKMQAQLYNTENKYQTFSQLLHHVPNAQKLHFLVSGAITNYLKQLNDVIPDVTNNLGLHFLKFNQYRFEIINSDLRNIEKHSVAINFYSEPLYYLEQVGNYLLTSKVAAAESENGTMQTDMFALMPYLTIYTYSHENNFAG